jgi:ketosteroid isomerase-like protein
MKWKRIALVLVTFSLLAVPLAWSKGGNAEQQIKTVTDEVSVALLKADTNSLEKLLADDYTGIHSDGRLVTKAQEIESVTSSTLKYETNDLQDLKIRVYGHTAVATARASLKGTVNGKPFSFTVGSTRVWVKQKGNWKSVSYQATRVSP